ncbi:hypothetical protein [Nostoc sp. GT001]|uniref:hypothetical protein n=1 Tax=Nostoc sp. GT001 TaxID=3056647 RepID=UPI0025AA7A42|nr:hypothetical protein [Nostoc sp. GT001]MDM9581552.1 hypothetical protein [Nostoc sp. GT001]
MFFISDLCDLYEKILDERVKEVQISLKSTMQKICRWFQEYKNWPDWGLSILCITLALLIAFLWDYLKIYEFGACFQGFLKNNLKICFDLLGMKDISGDIQKRISRFILLQIFLLGFVFSLLFLFLKFSIRLKVIRLFIFFLLGFLAVKYFDIINKSITTNKNWIFPENYLLVDYLYTFDAGKFLSLITIIILVTVLYLLHRWLSSSPGIIIQPFGFDDENQKDSLREKQSIADQLTAELHQISHIHNFLEDGKLKVRSSSSLLAVCREDIIFPLGEINGEKLENTLEELGTVTVSGGTSLQLGKLLLALRQLWLRDLCKSSLELLSKNKIPL